MDDDTEKIRIFKKVNELFEAAGKYFDVQPEKIQVDYEDVKLDGYFFSPSWIKGPKPTLFALNGGDEWSIENYFWLGPFLFRVDITFWSMTSLGPASRCTKREKEDERTVRLSIPEQSTFF